MKDQRILADGDIVTPRRLTSSHKTIIAHSGHRDLLPGDEPRLRQAVEAKLSEITGGAHHQYLLLTGIAEGADELVAATAAAMGIEVVLLSLDLPEEEERANTLRYQFDTDLVSIRPLTVPDLKRDANTAFEHLAHTLVSRATHLLVLWDGVDTTKPGGTSELVRIAIHSPRRKKKFQGTLHQLITPRLINPYPICGHVFKHRHAQPPPGPYEWSVTSFPRQRTRNRISAWNRYIAYNENFWRFFLPSILVLVTIVLGYIGFTALSAADGPASNSPSINSHKRLDAFFNAVNLVTFNSSALNTDKDIPLSLNIARFTGLLFVLNAFIVAFMLAIGSNNKNLLRIYLWKILGLRNIRLVIGLNQLSYPLALALKQQGAEVLLIDKDPDPNLRAEATRRGIRVMSGSAQSGTFLARIQAQRARDFYILEESDEENIRILHELDQLWAKYPRYNTQCYIYLKGSRAAEFISGPGRLSSHVKVRTFNFYETISRKLLTWYSADRFSTTCHSAEILLFGFTEMGRQLLLTLLQTVHTDEQHRLRITVFSRDAAGESEKFFHEYPCLWHDAVDNPLYEKPHAREIREYVFPRGVLNFKELPLSDASYFHDETIAQALTGNSAVSFYFCLEDTMQNAAYLSSLLPRMGGQQPNLQLFCHFNLPGESEQEHVAYVLNRQLPHTPVVLFGQLEEECRALATADFRIDDLAALIHIWYRANFPPQEWLREPRSFLRLARSEWETLPYAYQESSRRAADHLWIKLRYAGISPYGIQKQLLANTPLYGDIPPAVASALESKLPLLSRMEQRRWCAEKLLSGFLPLQDIYPDAISSAETWISHWNDPEEKTFKQQYQAQKLHIDLLPFEKLFDGEITVGNKRIRHSEKDKDRKQIEGIPYFLHVLFYKPS